MTASQILQREFLEIRAKLLEVAASFDRLDRGTGTVADDPQRELLDQALDILKADQPDRAEKLQLLFSRQYENDWREQFQLTNNNPKP